MIDVLSKVHLIMEEWRSFNRINVSVSQDTSDYADLNEMTLLFIHFHVWCSIEECS